VRIILRKALARLGVKPILFGLACGKYKASPFDEADVAGIRGEVVAVLEAALGRRVPDTAVEGQDFALHLLAAFAEACGGPDHAVLTAPINSFAAGVPLGYRMSLPRTPAVWERKAKWRSYEDDLFRHVHEAKRNYVSAREHVADVRAQFIEEAEAGRMQRVSLAAAQEEFGSRLAIASLGALEKSDDTFRVIHDGSHAVRVNPGIRPRGQVRMAGVGELKVVQGRNRRHGGAHFLLLGDFSKAHRRVKVRRADHGLQACALEDPQEVWLNRVGTFGIASAGYWWARLAAIVMRTGLYLQFQAWFWQLLFADDILLSASGPDTAEVLLTAVLWMVVIRAPIAWKKFRGGFEGDWIGYWCDFGRFRLGLNERRTDWTLRWLEQLGTRPAVLVQEVQEALGRFTFAVAVAEELKPFLGPFFAWVASVPNGAYLEVPILLRIVARFLASSIRTGGLGRDCFELGDERYADTVECFRSDAKAEGDDVGIGGWECAGGTPPGPGTLVLCKGGPTELPVGVCARGALQEHRGP